MARAHQSPATRTTSVLLIRRLDFGRRRRVAWATLGMRQASVMFLFGPVSNFDLVLALRLTRVVDICPWRFSLWLPPHRKPASHFESTRWFSQWSINTSDDGRLVCYARHLGSAQSLHRACAVSAACIRGCLSRCVVHAWWQRGLMVFGFRRRVGFHG